MRTREVREQRGVDVDQTAFPSLNKGSRQEPHPPGQHNGLNIVGFQFGLNQVLVSQSTGHAVLDVRQRKDFHRTSKRRGAFNGAGVCFVRHDHNRGVKRLHGLLVANEGFHPRTRP